MKKIIKIILTLFAIYLAVTNILHFITTWISLNDQGVSNWYMILSTFLGSWLLILGTVVLPFVPISIIKNGEEQDSFIKTSLKAIFYGFLAYFVSGLLLSGWFILILFIHDLIL